MPWSMQDKPNAVKYLHPRIQRKAIAIANAIIREGGDEGVAIATGIKQAKKSFGKVASVSIVKCAADYQQVKDSLMIDKARDKEMPYVKGPYISSALIGGGIGAGLGALSRSSGAGALIGGSLGLLTGLGIAQNIKNQRALVRAMSKNPELVKRYELVQKAEEIDNENAQTTGMYSGLYGGLISGSMSRR